MAGQEKRQAPRIQPFVASCQVVDGSRRYGAYLTDLSLTGARVSCQATPPHAEAWVTLEVRLGRPPSRVSLTAQVRWVGTGRTGHHFGVTFHRLDDEERRTLAAVFDEFHRRAAELA
ncbi:MAG TPA: PilZ domain-containing protein [Vicinamibacteria bacterium]|nr:PilZ domain-containing protein [Vicinamibacteria bacterium]